MVFYKKKKTDPINDFSYFCNMLKENPVELTNYTLSVSSISEKSVLLKPKADTFIYRNSFIPTVKIEVSDGFSEVYYYINRFSLVFFQLLVFFFLIFGFYGLFHINENIFIIPVIISITLEAVSVFIFYNTVKITEKHLSQLINSANK